MVEEIISKMADGGHFGFGALAELAHTFALTFIEDKSSEKRSFALSDHRSAVNDPTNRQMRVRT